MQTGRAGPVRRVALAAVAIGGLVGTAVPAAAQDAAPGGQSGSDAAATKVAATGDGTPYPGLDWSTTLEGYGNSGNELVFDSEGHVLYQGTNHAPDPAQETLVAVDRATGEVDWTLPGVSRRCGVAASDDGMVYGITTHPTGGEELLAIDAATGEVAQAFSPQAHGAPEISECFESLRLAPDGTLVVLHGRDGANMDVFATADGISHLWTRDYHVDADDRTSLSDRPVISADGTAVYQCREVPEEDRPDDADDLATFEKLDLATGDPIDSIAIHENAWCHTLGVLAIEDGAIVSAEGHGAARYRMLRIADDGNELSIDWQVTWSRDEDDDESGLVEYPAAALSLSGDTIVTRIAGGGSYVGVDVATGEVQWEYSAGLTNTYEHQPVDRHGNVYVSNHDALLESFDGDGNPRFDVPRDALLGEQSTFGAKMIAVGPDGGIFLRGVVEGDHPTIVRLDTAPTRRFAGLSRYATASQLAMANFRPGVDTVYLATGRNFPDALTGGPLAALNDSPVLLAAPTELPDDTIEALQALRPANVVAIGGTAAISDEVLAEAAAEAEDAATDRIFGANRYGTAAAIAERLPASDTVYIGTGANYPDTLAGGPATDGAPILLATRDRLPQETIAVLTDRAPANVVALGGPAVVSNDVLAQAAAAAGGASTERLSGVNRYTTAVDIAQSVVDAGAFTGTVYVAVGTNYPDAVAAAPAAEAAGAPIVLTASDALPDEVADWLAGLDGLEHVVVLGGEGAVSPEVEAELAALAG